MENKCKEKISEYERFINDTLKTDLRDIEKKLEQKSKELDEWNEVKQVAKFFKLYKEQVEDSMHILTPFFEQDQHEIHMRAEIDNMETLFINIGCDCTLEMDLEEACRYADIRIKFIERQVKQLRALAVKVKVNIKLTLLAINELHPIENIQI